MRVTDRGQGINFVEYAVVWTCEADEQSQRGNEIGVSIQLKEAKLCRLSSHADLSMPNVESGPRLLWQVFGYPRANGSSRLSP